MLATQGMGIFLPAHWTLPQNPLLEPPVGLCNLGDGCGCGLSDCGLGAIVTGIYQMTDNGVVPEILAKRAKLEYLEKNPLGPVGMAGCGPSTCPCELGYCGTGLNGVMDDIMASVTGMAADWKTWAIVGGGVLALVMLTGGGGSQRRAELAAAKSRYKASVARIKADRPRRYQKYV